MLHHKWLKQQQITMQLRNKTTTMLKAQKISKAHQVLKRTCLQKVIEKLIMRAGRKIQQMKKFTRRKKMKKLSRLLAKLARESKVVKKEHI